MDVAENESAPPQTADDGLMYAVTHPAYGSPEVLRYQKVPKAEPAAGEVLVRVRASSICRGDTYLVSGKPYLLRLMGFGVLKPKNRVAGQDFAGEIVKLGENANGFELADAVYGQVVAGAFAEFVRVPVARLSKKPSNLSFEETAALPDSAMTALQGLRDIAGLQPGQHVLINGASGGVGTFAIQIAKAMDAKVTAVCSGRNVDLVRELGADTTVDYTREDFTAMGNRYDVVLDLAGNRGLSEVQKALAPRGVFVACSAGPGGDWLGPVVWLLRVAGRNLISSQKLAAFVLRPNADDLARIRQLAEDGRIRPVIEQRLPLQDAARAVSHVQTGRARGKTVLIVP